MFLPSAVQTIQHFCSAMKGLVFKVNLALIAVLAFVIIILTWQIARNGALLNLEVLSQVILQQQSEKRSPWDAGRPLLKPLFSSRLETLKEACRKMDGLKRVICFIKTDHSSSHSPDKIGFRKCHHPGKTHPTQSIPQSNIQSKMGFLTTGEADATQVEWLFFGFEYFLSNIFLLTFLVDF